MCRRECLAGEQCEHEAICHAPDLSMLTAILANAGGKVHIRGGWQLNDITAGLTRTYGRPFKGYMDKAWWRVGNVTVTVSESGDDRLCACECPQCGATAKFDVELELDRYPGSGRPPRGGVD